MSKTKFINLVSKKNDLIKAHLSDKCHIYNNTFINNETKCLELCKSKIPECKTQCNLYLPVTYCSSCNTLSVMPSGKCLYCSSSISKDKIIENISKGKVFLVNACIFGARLASLATSKFFEQDKKFIENDILSKLPYSVISHGRMTTRNNNLLFDYGEGLSTRFWTSNTEEDTEKANYTGSLFLCKK